MATTLNYEKTFDLPNQHSLDISIFVSTTTLDGKQTSEITESKVDVADIVDELLFQFILKNNLNVEHFLSGKKVLKVLKESIEAKLDRTILKIVCMDTISNKKNILK